MGSSFQSPQNQFQRYRPINDILQAILSVAGDIAGGISKNRFRAITFDWSDLRPNISDRVPSHFICKLIFQIDFPIILYL